MSAEKCRRFRFFASFCDFCDFFLQTSMGKEIQKIIQTTSRIFDIKASSTDTSKIYNHVICNLKSIPPLPSVSNQNYIA